MLGLSNVMCMIAQDSLCSGTTSEEVVCHGCK